MPATTAAPLALGAVVLDDYANPAVIVRIEEAAPGRPRYSIMQTCGSDRGRVTTPPLRDGVPVVCEGPADRLEVIRAIVRDEARRQGLRWDAHGITR